MATKTVDELVEEALEAFDDPGAKVSDHLRRAIRIATKRQDYLGLLRLMPWTMDFKVGQGMGEHPASAEARQNLIALVGEQSASEQIVAAVVQHTSARQFGESKQGQIFGQSLPQLEAQLAEYNEIHESYNSPPANLTPIDTYFVAKDYDSAQAKLLPMRRGLGDVIARAKQLVQDFLIETERQVEQGQRRPHIFERGREYIERSLQQRAPEALAKFQSAEDALARGTDEDLAHALTSCRRMIKALADVLYPATNEAIVSLDGQERTMSDDAYRNRLLQFATEELGKSTHQSVLKETLRSLGSRLQRLNELSSKGVHDDVSRAEAETCIMWTYLTAADFLRLADGTDPRLHAGNSAEVSGLGGK